MHGEGVHDFCNFNNESPLALFQSPSFSALCIALYVLLFFSFRKLPLLIDKCLDFHGWELRFPLPRPGLHPLSFICVDLSENYYI
jgi:hypothetical protein